MLQLFCFPICFFSSETSPRPCAWALARTFAPRHPRPQWRRIALPHLPRFDLNQLRSLRFDLRTCSVNWFEISELFDEQLNHQLVFPSNILFCNLCLDLTEIDLRKASWGAQGMAWLAFWHRATLDGGSTVGLLVGSDLRHDKNPWYKMVRKTIRNSYR